MMGICHQWLETLPPPNGILKKLQRRGRNDLTKCGFPRDSHEAWRLTDRKKLEKLLTLPISSTSKTPANKTTLHNGWMDAPQAALRVVLNPQDTSWDSIKWPDGMRPLSSSELEEHLGSTVTRCACNNDWSVAINHASATNLLALKIEGQDLPPLELIAEASEGNFLPSRVLLLLEDQAKLEVLQVTLGSGNSAHSHLLEVSLGKEAVLKHGWLALGGGEGNLLAHLTIAQEANSHYSLTSVQHGWSFGRLEPRVVQTTGHATTTLKGLQISTGKQQIATYSTVRFDGPEGCLDQLNKTAVSDNSHCIFNGAINVPKIAQRTNAAQLSRNLLISPRAKIDTKPELEIVADDVRCTHGATVSQLQEDELFYMRSRGINTKEATKLLLQGYCKEILDDLPLEDKQYKVLSQLIESVKE